MMVFRLEIGIKFRQVRLRGGGSLVLSIGCWNQTQDWYSARKKRVRLSGLVSYQKSASNKILRSTFVDEQTEQSCIHVALF